MRTLLLAAGFVVLPWVARAQPVDNDPAMRETMVYAVNRPAIK